MQQYHNLLQEILDKGLNKSDRTGTGTRSIFGHQMKFDLSEGFPLVTTKEVHFKSILVELLWFLSGNTNIQYLTDNNVKIWNEWADKNGNIGAMYGYNWISWENANPRWKMIPNKKAGCSDLLDISKPLVNLSTVKNKGKLTGTINSKGKNPFIVLGLTGNKIGNHKEYEIQFLDSGSIKKVSSSVAKSGSAKDYYSRELAGVGYFGDINTQNLTPVQSRLMKVWRGMIQRCYDESASRYPMYGGRNTTVHQRWHSFANFIEDAPLLKGYNGYLVSGYELDKDYYGANQYGPKTSLFISHNINIKMQNQCRPTMYMGEAYPTIKDVAKVAGVSSRTIKNFLSGKNAPSIINSDTLIPINPQKGYSFRPILYENQIKNVIDEIKNNPNSRRLIVTSWNPSDMNQKDLKNYKRRAALDSCHLLFQFYVREGYLDCQLYQRSADAFLGVPFNIASYALLTTMVAQVCGYKPGVFVHTLGDAHIYQNHLKQVELQLTRDFKTLPTVTLNPNVKYIEYFTYTDFTLNDYNPHPKIKGDISV